MKRAALAMAALALWAVAGCRAIEPVAPKPPPTAKKSRPAAANGSPRESGRAFLLGSQPEKPGYALYSYLLLGGPPDDTTRERYRAAVLAFLGKIVELDNVSHRMPLTGAGQERFWEERRMEQLALELRTEIEKVAGVVPGIKEALTTWLVWVK
jgi:hypothetical protein